MKKRFVFGSSAADLNAFERNLLFELFYERIEVIFHLECRNTK